MAVRATVPLHLVESLQWHVEFVAAGKFQNQIITVEALHRETVEASILCDAMLNVDDIVAHIEIFQRREKRGRFVLGLRFMARAFGKQLLFRQHSQAQVRSEKSR